MAHLIDSMELVHVLAEAEDIARNVNQRLTTAHQLLAFFTVPNRAELLLRDRGLDEDKILAVLAGKPEEPEGTERELRDRARDVAAGLAADEVDCLHLLIAMSRVRSSSAHQLLAACGLQLGTVRNIALSYFTSRMPRRMRELAPQPARSTRPTTSRALSAPSPAPPAGPPAVIPEESPHARPSARRSPAPMPAAPMPGTVAEREPAESRGDGDPAPGLWPPSRTPSNGTAALPTHVRGVTSSAGSPAQGGHAPASEGAPEGSLDPDVYPWLTALGRNLTVLAAARKLDPLVGRDREVDEAIDVLGKRRSNNPLLLGEPGVGKTAIVEGIAQKLLADRGDERVIVEIDMAGLLAGTQLRGSFSEKLNGIKDEVRRAGGRCIVFIDEIHTVMGAGATGDGPQDAANELKAALARGEFPCIGATTHDEYRQHIEKDPALERRFTPVLVREPSVPETVRILQGLAPRYEQHHEVEYRPEALEAAASLAARYVNDRFLPDKAIAVLDLAGSRARREGVRVVSLDLVRRVVAKMADIPESRLVDEGRDRVQRVGAHLGERVLGHSAAIARIAAVLRRNFAGFASRRPMASLLLAGPTGVGKTELARALADALFGNPQALVRIDMSEYSEPTGVARLIGAAPGYVGYAEGGQLTEAVRRRPSAVVLLDEIDKAHRDVLLLLLQALEEGRLTDGRGRHVDFSNTVVVLTSNLGSYDATRGGSMGFRSASPVEDREQQGLASARAILPSELWNRIDEKLFLGPLDRATIKQIAIKLLSDSSARLFADRGIRYTAGDDVAEHLLENGGLDVTLGARPVRAAIERLVEAPLADRILAGTVVPGKLVRVSAAAGTLQFAS